MTKRDLYTLVLLTAAIITAFRIGHSFGVMRGRALERQEIGRAYDGVRERFPEVAEAIRKAGRGEVYEYE